MSEHLLPPGVTEVVDADRALVIAPHYDDELYGCGGLLAGLCAGGCEVTVLFLTDSAGGVEGVPAGETAKTYGERRRAEAGEVAEHLGIASLEHLGLPDGGLAARLEELGQSYGEALERLRPDLVLVPSPLEVTPDHRASFVALHRLLSAVRAGEPLAAAIGELCVLAYEVNHPAYPDLLVDVSDQLEVLGQAAELYRSQQSRHDYKSAALGLRRFRTHTLPSEVTAAEGYRRLRSGDFQTRSLAALIAHLGGVSDSLQVQEPLPVSVVVRTKDRPELLREALDSLAATAYPRLQVVLVNDGGDADSLPREASFSLQRVDLQESRGRAAAANEGISAASGEWIGFLDDDDLVYPEHLATLTAAACGAGVQVVYSDAAVALYRPTEKAGSPGACAGWVNVERRLPYSRDFDPEILLLDNYIPFNTVMIERELLRRVGELDESLPIFEDWDLLIRLSEHASFHHLRTVTCEYRHFAGSSHHALGSRSPNDEFVETKARVLGKHQARLTPTALVAAVGRLRKEVVDLGERECELRTAQRRDQQDHRRHRDRLHQEIERLRAEVSEQSLERERVAQRFFALEKQHVDLEERHHRLNGELVDLRGEQRRWLESQADTAAKIQLLYDQEERLRSTVEQLEGTVAHRDEQLEATYAEIARLNALIAEMEQTRAWRLHRMFERGRRRSE